MTNASTSTLLVLHCPAGGGHKAAARAIAEAAAMRGVEAEVVDALALTPSWFARAYVGTHLTSSERAPGVYGRLYAALDRKHAVADGFRGAFDRAIGAALRRYVVVRAPAAVVATHFFPMAVLGHARRRGRLAPPVIGVVTDYAAHAFWAERGVDRFCAAPGRAVRDLARNGVPEAAIAKTGIPIRPAFGAIAPLELPRAGEPLRVLVTSGGFGVGPTVEVVQSFARARDGGPVELTVVCGDNPRRVEETRRAAAEAGVCARVIGFERDMPARMAEAHVVVGKPGGLTVTEALAAGRPLVLVGACPGQEASNEAWVVSNGAGVAARPSEVGPLAAALRRRDRLLDFARAARSLATPDAALRVVDVALREAGLGERLTRRAVAA